MKTEMEAAIDAVMARLDVIGAQLDDIRTLIEKKPAKKPKTRTPGEFAVGPCKIRSIGDANDYGFYNARVEGDEIILATKSSSLAADIKAAWIAKQTVILTYNTQTKGKYVNYYVQTVEIVDSPLPATAATSIEDDDCPF